MACDGVLYQKKKKKKEKQKPSNFGWLYFLMQTFSYSPLSMYNSKTQFSFDFV